jgi:two-component system, LytTR family, sensor kinase
MRRSECLMRRAVYCDALKSVAYAPQETAMTAFKPTTFDLMRRNRDVLFFTLNAIGWSAWGFAQYLTWSWYEMDSRFAPVLVVGSVAGFLLTTLLRYLCRILWRQEPIVMAGGALVAAFLATLPMRAAINFAQRDLIAPEIIFEHWYDFFLVNVLKTSPIMLCWMGLYFGLRFYQANLLERETALRAMALAQSAQLKMLRYQLNPHFLFNTLNAISTLVLDQKNTVANTVITRLADFLRYTLDQDPMKTVTLTQEVTALNLYLEIEKLRFGTRLNVTIDIDSAAKSMAVPSLLLQPLIENAIKYAIAPSEHGGTLAIRGQVKNGNMILSLQDNGPGMQDTSRIDTGRGVGLRNTRERLLAMYGEQARLDLTNTQPGLRITLTFPATLSEAPKT